jgi:hypothetical protein
MFRYKSQLSGYIKAHLNKHRELVRGYMSCFLQKRKDILSSCFISEIGPFFSWKK